MLDHILMNNFACPCCKRLFRVGAMMLVLHDASDVFLEAAKVFKYSEKQFGASFCFGLFALSWLLLRLIYFPFWIIRESRLSSNSSLSSFFFFFKFRYSFSACHFSSKVTFLIVALISYHSCKIRDLSKPLYMTIYYMFNTMLLTLLIFHIYWWKLICAMIIRQLRSRGKVGEDIRSG